MKNLPEYFDPAQMMLPGENKFCIKRPYLDYANSFPVKFEDYSANNRLQCYLYQKLLFSCFNKYGIFESFKHIHCQVI